MLKVKRKNYKIKNYKHSFQQLKNVMIKLLFKSDELAQIKPSSA